MANEKPPIIVPQAVCDELNRVEKAVDDSVKGKSNITPTYTALVKDRLAIGPATKSVYEANPALKARRDARDTEAENIEKQQDVLPKGALSKNQMKEWDALQKKGNEVFAASTEENKDVQQALNKKCRLQPVKP